MFHSLARHRGRTWAFTKAPRGPQDLGHELLTNGGFWLLLTDDALRRLCSDDWAAPPRIPKCDAIVLRGSTAGSGKEYKRRHTGVRSPSGPRPCVANQESLGLLSHTSLSLILPHPHIPSAISLPTSRPPLLHPFFSWRDRRPSSTSRVLSLR